jgi:site-specific recombinase XerD
MTNAALDAVARRATLQGVVELQLRHLAVAGVLGHRGVTTTMIYTHVLHYGASRRAVHDAM